MLEYTVSNINANIITAGHYDSFESTAELTDTAGCPCLAVANCSDGTIILAHWTKGNALVQIDFSSISTSRSFSVLVDVICLWCPNHL